MIGRYFVRFLVIGLVCSTIAPGGTAHAGELLQSPVETCKQTLYAERDRQWQPKLKEALAKYQLSKEGKADYERLKRELREDIKYLGFIDPTSDFALVSGEIFQAIKTKANLIEDLLEFVPVGKVVKKTKETFYKLIKTYKRVDEAVTNGTEGIVVDIAIDYIPGGSAVKNLAENIHTAVKMPAEHESFKDEMDRQLAKLDANIAKMEARMREAEKDAKVYDQLGLAIEQYCNDYPEDIVPSVAEVDALDSPSVGEMDNMVEKKRAEDQPLIQDILVTEKYINDQSLIEGSASNSDAADQFIGGLLEGLMMGLEVYSGSQGGGYSSGGGGGGGCAQVQAQIQADRNWLNANGGSAAAGPVRQAHDQNVAYYNANCL